MVKRIESRIDKQRSETLLRAIWQECFADTAAYEDFYFTKVYSDNIVYAVEDKGMLHLNPYRCMVKGEERILHYIVGVGTRAVCRRQGVMSRLLKRAMEDMYAAGELFTYLMPADEKYYLPFSFVGISDKKESVLIGRRLENKLSENCAELPETVQSIKHIQFVQYKQLVDCWNRKERQQLYDKVESILKERYDIYVKHDETYFQLLVQEKGCQGGDVIFCFDTTACAGRLAGFFAYGMDGTHMHVEQTVFLPSFTSKIINAAILEYKRDAEKIIMEEKLPFMMRIINLEECIRLFGQNLISYAAKEKRILVTDEILSENNGIYELYIENAHISIRRQHAGAIRGCNEKDYFEESAWDIHMTIEEISRLIFGKKGENRVFFAEIV